ncbi:hypothetical protein HZS38_16445 [Xenorhabdus nematophila]|nr:hypothetical protein [Xenorhabdus nematophila]MBA0020652.1 hypothetical protein [Xenorhabdus nematophila]MCB4426632.1 hypothetical protein [Xenorhabdus nematophila]QNJ36298.1 hypothetical protein H8F46_16645 [Xenorhabdus nematophila]
MCAPNRGASSQACHAYLARRQKTCSVYRGCGKSIRLNRASHQIAIMAISRILALHTPDSGFHYRGCALQQEAPLLPLTLPTL